MDAECPHAVELARCANWFDRFAEEITDAEPTRQEQIDGQWQAGRAGILIYQAVKEGSLSIPDLAELVAQADYRLPGIAGLSDAGVSGQFFSATVELMVRLEGPFFPSPDITEDEANTEEYQLVIRRQINAEGAVVCRRLADMIRKGTNQHLSGDDCLCTGEALIDACRSLSKCENLEEWTDEATAMAHEVWSLFYRFRCYFDGWRLPDACEDFLEAFPQTVSDGNMDQAARIAAVAGEAILDELGDTLPAEIVRTSDPPYTRAEAQLRRLTRWNQIVGMDASVAARHAEDEMSRFDFGVDEVAIETGVGGVTTEHDGPASSELDTGIGQSQEPQRIPHVYDDDCERCAAAFITEWQRLTKRNEKPPTLHNFCKRFAKNFSLAHSTLYKKMSCHRPIWDPKGCYGARPRKKTN